MNKCFALSMILGLICSCVAEYGQDGLSADPAAVSCIFSVAVDSPEVMDEWQRSSFVDVDMARISDLNVFVYHDGMLVSDCCRYFDDMSDLMLSFPEDRDGFDIFMLGNVGRVMPPERESDLTTLRCVLDSRRDFSEKGFPVAEKFAGYKKGDPAHFKVKRLVGQYNIRMRKSAADAEYVVKDVRLKNCARDVYPFGNDVAAIEFGCSCMPEECICGDYLTDDDMAKLNAGETVSLYFVENLQGVLLPDNTDRKLKIPSSLDLVGKGIADRCTYLEVTADVTTSAARYIDGKYRFYLGQDQTTDFSIRRNTLYSVVLDFTQNMVCEEEWRIEVDDPEVVSVRIDKEEAMVIKGAEDMIYVQAYDNKGDLMDFDVEVLSSNGYINVYKNMARDYRERTEQGKSLGLRITSNVAIDGLYAYGIEPSYKTETVRISSKDKFNGKPVFTKDIKVRIYHKLFPLLLKLEKGDCYRYPGQGMTVYNIILRGCNPMNLGLRVNTEQKFANGGSNSSEGFGYNFYDSYGSVNSGNGSTWIGAVTEKGQPMGYISMDSPDDMSRMDFTVSGWAGGATSTGRYMTYPRLLQSAAIYMGAGTEAEYGPCIKNTLNQYVVSMLPMKLSDHPDEDTSFWVEVGSETVGPGKSVTKLSKVMTSGEVNVYAGGSIRCYSASSTAGVGARKFVDDPSYEACPFYFVNGGMVLAYCSVNLDCSAPKYEKNASSSKITTQYYAPGRDLFFEKKGADDFLCHNSYYEIKCWNTILNKLKCKQVSKYYDGKFYMTINGCSTWTGASMTSMGYFTDEY